VNSFAEEYKPIPIDGTKMECSEVDEEIKWSFCITKVPGSKNENVLYHFHGRNGNATWWNDKTYHTGKVHKQWLSMEKDPPSVISISFGKLWMLTAKKDNKGLIDTFVNKIMPNVEARLGHKVGDRMLFGISMGGVNSIFASLHRPSLFKKTAVLCSPLPTISHHSSFSKMFDYYKTSSISLYRTAMKIYMSWKFFSTQEIWDINNPVDILKNKTFTSLPDFYVSCGKKDDWDCMNGSQAFVNELKRIGQSVEWVPREGGHCDIDHKSVASFLIK